MQVRRPEHFLFVWSGVSSPKFPSDSLLRYSVVAMQRQRKPFALRSQDCGRPVAEATLGFRQRRPSKSCRLDHLHCSLTTRTASAAYSSLPAPKRPVLRTPFTARLCSSDIFKKAAELRAAQKRLEEEMIALHKAAAQLQGHEQVRLQKLLSGEEVLPPSQSMSHSRLQSSSSASSCSSALHRVCKRPHQWRRNTH